MGRWLIWLGFQVGAQSGKCAAGDCHACLLTASSICSTDLRTVVLPFVLTSDTLAPSLVSSAESSSPGPYLHMHQCLCVPEILGRIIEHLEPEDALALALTSKSFLEQALDHCWREIFSFDPLIACLPSDLWREERLPSAFEVYSTILVSSDPSFIRSISERALASAACNHAGGCPPIHNLLCAENPNVPPPDCAWDEDTVRGCHASLGIGDRTQSWSTVASLEGFCMV